MHHFYYLKPSLQYFYSVGICPLKSICVTVSSIKTEKMEIFSTIAHIEL